MKANNTAPVWENVPLGKPSEYVSQYTPSLLYPIPRELQRNGLTTLPFHGVDLWTAFEVSWLNAKGKPVVALGEFWFPCTSPCLVESKSFKLYLNSFNQTRFENVEAVEAAIRRDVEAATGAPAIARLTPLDAAFANQVVANMPGVCLDDLDVEIDTYECAPHLLRVAADKPPVEETLYTHLFKSNCRITGQPDWASLMIRYKGPAIEHESLLKYLVSFRGQTEFHENCVEQLFLGIMEHCKPEKLTVYARYTRRGGLDINPFRSNFETLDVHQRLSRQ